MAVPMTKVNYIDRSAIETTRDIVAVDNRPLFFVVGSFDKGTEDLNVVAGQDFYDMYGTPLFTKHGQNGIQAQRLINAGARLLVKRVVADDATLSNLVLYATVKQGDEYQDINLVGAAPEGQEAPENGAEGEYININHGDEDDDVVDENTYIKWHATSFANCKTYEEVKAQALTLYDEEAGVYPLFIYTDNGRGTSAKAIRITPNYQVSKGLGFTMYSLKVYEGSNVIENKSISFNPGKSYGDQNYALDNSTCFQVKAEVIDTMYDAYIAKLSTLIAIDTDTLGDYDTIFGYDFKGNAIPNLVLDPESIDLNAMTGVSLSSGTNGAFGNVPVATEEWADKIRAVFAGEVTDQVWDVDTYKIAAILDANFPQAVKDAISNFVTWREDCVFFRDLGVGNDSFSAIQTAYAKNTIKNKFIADYSTSYTIKDPNTFKNIEVTMLYDMAACIVRGFNGGIHNPLAGTYNGYILDSAIEGTLNFSPIITPAVNQLEAFEDMRLNYAIFQEGQCVVQSEYTSQEAYTEWSYINNIMGIQEVMRDLRTNCPANRFRLVTGTDLTEYAIACNHVLEKYLSRFYILRFTYTEDPTLSMQKIFYASIEVAYNQFANTEIFDVYALNAANVMAANSATE